MGVLTTMYSVPPGLMKKIRADNEQLGRITGDAEDAVRCDSIDFDKHYCEVLGLLRAAGHDKLHAILDNEGRECELEFDSYDLLLVKPAQVHKALVLFEGVTPASVKARLRGQEVTDYDGKVMSEGDIESYLSELPRIRKLLEGAVEGGHSVIVTEA